MEQGSEPNHEKRQVFAYKNKTMFSPRETRFLMVSPGNKWITQTFLVTFGDTL